MVALSSASTSLKEYLKKYESNNEKEKKTKKKKKVKTDATGVIVVDEDPIWQKPVKTEEEEEESADEELPQVNEDIEVKRMKRLEQLRARRPYGAISEDGSGWVSVSSTSNNITSDDLNSDLSPPRKRIARNDTPSPKPELKSSSPGAAHKRRARNDTPSPDREFLPSRKRSARNDTPSPEPQLKPSSTRDADISPPRRRRVRNDTPEREMKPLSTRDVDMSPPQRCRARNASSPEPKANRFDTSDADLSPPRRRQKHGQSLPDKPDTSPPRRGRNGHGDVRAYQSTDLSPLRKHKDQGGLSIISSHLSANGNAPDSDLSPPRKARPASPTMRQRPKTGLVTGKDVKEEIAKTKKEDWLRFKEMDPLISGQGAEPVYRDKTTGERMSKEEFLKSKKMKEEKEKPKEIKLEWGKGLAQKREHEARLQELESEKDKPFARSRDDPEIDRMLKERVRWGDPMAHLVQQSEPILPDLGASERMKESGFIIPQEIPNHSWIKRRLDAPPNRYGIKPGRHWDGVDRSTGYEKQIFKRTNEKQATEKERYLWSVADM